MTGDREIDERGYAIVAGVLDEEEIERLLVALEQANDGDSVRRRKQVYAIRNLLGTVPAVRELALSERLRQLVAPVLGPHAFPVDGICFDKPESANWGVPWHQDPMIPVKERVEVAGFGPRSVKAGVPHVMAPAFVLERLLIVRLHLDACDDENGPLRVVPGSHRYGLLSDPEIDRWRERETEVVCRVPRGGALLMRPLLLHASPATRTPGHRRVVHLIYTSEGLPDGLVWYHQKGNRREQEVQQCAPVPGDTACC
jgi:ectoine hydroxylase-related dioxygenase (phytanoyl-CoA dioxygenase family)